MAKKAPKKATKKQPDKLLVKPQDEETARAIVAAVPSAVASFGNMEALAGFGLEDTTTDDYAIPFVRILQPMIGRTTHKFSRLPANVHDYRYFVGGGKEERSAADANFIRMLRKSVRNGRLSEPIHTMALVRCLWYYLAVRLLGVLFFRWSNGGFWQWLRALFGK